MPGYWKSTCAALAVVTLFAGCGLKGALELPERPTNMVIRPGPGQAGAAGTPSPPGTGAPAATPPADEPERLPPPELPRGRRGGAT